MSFILNYFLKFSVEPVTPVIGVTSKDYSCKSHCLDQEKVSANVHLCFRVRAENSTSMAIQSSTEKLEQLRAGSYCYLLKGETIS